MIIKKIDITKINPAPYNPRKDLQPDDAEYQKLLKVIDKFGLVEPLVWNKKTGNLIGGHQRLKILQKRGDTKIEVSVVDIDLNEEKALNLALNKISGEWNKEKLSDLFETMSLPDIQLGGFDLDEIDKLTIPDEEPADFTLDDFEFDDIYEPCWFVIRAPIDDYEMIKTKLMKLDAVVEGSLDGQLKP